MKNRQQAIALGLRVPAKDVCMDCHQEKPSHEFMHLKPFNFDEMYKRIAHKF